VNPPCTLLTEPDAGMDELCPNCGHSPLVHPGIAGGNLRACVVCELVAEIPRPLEAAEVIALDRLYRGQGSRPRSSVELLTQDEHRVIQLLAEAFNLWAAKCAAGNDLLEFAMTIHHAQHAVMAQAAARAYPDRYRLAGGPPVARA
jgi:hypothetical protein